MTEEFKNALSSFTFDAACGRGIRHLAENGYSAEQIQALLDYPVSIDRIRQEMKRLSDEKKDIESGKIEDYRIIKETGKYGRTTFRRVPRE